MIKEMMSFFGLSEVPFTKEIPTEHLQHLPSLTKCLSALHMLIETKGIGVLTGKSGAGKSCLLRMLKDELHTGLYKVVYLCHTSIGIQEFYTHLSHGLGLEPNIRRSKMFRAIKDRIIHLAKQGRVHPVVLIDEAHFLNNDILRELRLLTNFDIDSYNAMTVLLCGQENLLQKFGLSILESLANSITVSVSVAGLPREETYAYLENRIKVSGGNPALFTKNAMALIHQASSGILRSINQIASGSLLKAYYSKSSQIEVEHVESVIKR